MLERILHDFQAKRPTMQCNTIRNDTTAHPTHPAMPHPPSLSWIPMHSTEQLNSAHRGHRYAPTYPQLAHSRRAGVLGAGAAAVTYGGVGDDGSSSNQSRRLFFPYSARLTFGVCFFFAAASARPAGEFAGGGGGWKEAGRWSVGFVRCCQRVLRSYETRQR